MNLQRLKVVIKIIVVLSMFNACKHDPIETPFEPPICTEVYTPKAFTHEIIGFYPYYRQLSLPIHTIPWSQLTRVIYSFATPLATGGFTTGNLSQIADIIQTAHQNGVEVFFSLGGGGSDAFPSSISTTGNREKTIQDILILLGTYCFDGVDIDYEIFSGSNVDSKLTMFMEELDLQLRPYGYKISMDVYPGNYGGQNISNNIEAYVDYIHIMGYNFSGSWSAEPGPHSAFEQVIGSGNTSSSTGIAYWENFRGWEKSKLILGVPFYGRDFDNGGAAITYINIIALDPAAALVNQWGNIYYDGLPAIEQKSNYIRDNNYRGMMIWEIGQDSNDPALSLLGKMAGVLNP